MRENDSTKKDKMVARTIDKLVEVVKEKDLLEQVTISLRVKFDNTNQVKVRERVPSNELLAELNY